MDAGKKKKKKKEKKKRNKNELCLGAGIILNQELTYSRHWGKWAAGACQRPDTSFLDTQVRARANRWLAGKIYYKLKLTNCKQIVSCIEII